MGTGLCRNTNDTVFLFRTDTNQRIGKDVNKAFAQVRQNKIQSTALQHIIATALTFGATVDQISKLDV